MLFLHHQIPEGSPSKPPEVRAPSPTLPWHPCKGNQHQPRLTPIAWDGFLERDCEPDTNTVTARDLWPSNANFLILPTHRLGLVSRSHNCHVPPAEYFVFYGIFPLWGTAGFPQLCLERGQADPFSTRLSQELPKPQVPNPWLQPRNVQIVLG